MNFGKTSKSHSILKIDDDSRFSFFCCQVKTERNRIFFVESKIFFVKKKNFTLPFEQPKSFES